MSRYRRGEQLLRSSARPQGLRQGNRVFYVVADGEATEYDYLRHLNRIYGPDHRFLIQTHNQRRGLSASQVVDRACEAFEKLGADGIEVWALFDHDGQRDIDQACARARRHGIQDDVRCETIAGTVRDRRQGEPLSARLAIPKAKG